jgi:hypothetical protein
MKRDDALDGAETVRTKGGRFAAGNPGGPGRPRRATERAYLAALSEACPPETWAAIVAKAVEDATAGDRFAREWLAAFLVGQPGGSAPSLHELAVEEAAGSDPVERGAALARESDALDALFQRF